MPCAGSGLRAAWPSLLGVCSSDHVPSVEDRPMIGATLRITEDMQAGFAYGAATIAIVVIALLIFLEDRR